jgi:cell division inhibitor SepF
MSKTFVEKINSLWGLQDCAEDDYGESFSQRSPLRSLRVIEMETIRDAKKVLSSLEAGEPVILNLEKVENESKQEVLDFLCGVVYALDGQIEKVRIGIYLVVPKGIQITYNDVWNTLYR